MRFKRFILPSLFTLLLTNALSIGHASIVESGHSALWFDPDRSGEGWVLEMLSEDHALVYWYTYDDQGNQRWLQGIGAVASDEQGEFLDFSELYITRGGRFGPDFDPDDVEIEIVGDGVMRFSDCNHGSFSYSAFDQSQVIEIQRLTKTMAAGCAPIHGVPGEPVRDYAGQSGTWFDPARDGEGFSMHWLSRDEALVTWYTYDDEGNQRWMVGNGLFVDGKIEFSMIHTTQGGRFGTDFDPDDVELVEWGSLTMELACLDGDAEFESVLPEFGSGGMDLSRLTILDKPDCPWIRPGFLDLYDFELTPVPLAFDGSPPGLRAHDIADDGTVVAWAPNETIWLWRPGDDEFTELSSDHFMRDPLTSGAGARIIASAQAPAVADGEIYGPRIWDSEAGWEPLPGPVFDRSRALSLSASGNIVAGVGRNWEDSDDKPWVWTPESGQIVLPTTPETALSAPLGVSDDATIIVGSVLQLSPRRMQAIRWVGDSEPEFLYDHLGHPLGGTGACDSSCNVVVGAGQGEEATDHPYRTQAWFWKGTGEMDYFGSLPDALPNAPGAPYAPSGISGDGTIVAGRYLLATTQGTLGSMGFLWTQVTGLTSIKDVLEGLDVGDESWLEMTVWISAQGDLLLLDGRSRKPTDPEPRRRAYLLRMLPVESMQSLSQPLRSRSSDMLDSRSRSTAGPTRFVSNILGVTAERWNFGIYKSTSLSPSRIPWGASPDR